MFRNRRSQQCLLFATALAGLSLVSALVGCSGSGQHSIAPAGTQAPAAIPLPVIAQGVKIDNIPVGGETAAQATQTIRNAVISNAGKIVFRISDKTEGGSFHYGITDFGGVFDYADAVSQAMTAPANSAVPLPLKLDPKAVALHISRVADDWRIPLQEPKVVFADDGKRIRPGHAGREVDQTNAVKEVLANLPSLTKPTVEDDIPFIASKPQVKANQITGLTDTLVSFTTTFNPGNVTRTNNLMLAIKNINGTVIGPGEVFSYNDSVGPRTQDTGFQDAIIYVNNRMKKDVGGGICQGSSTLYNCVLLANLPIVERHAHSLPVHYVPAGRDATVAWGGDDFKFRNNTAKPIVVHAVATDGGVLTESLIGDRSAMPHPDADVDIAVSPKRTYPDGYAVTSYRIVHENGVLIAKEPLGVSFYHNLVGDVPH